MNDFYRASKVGQQIFFIKMCAKYFFIHAKNFSNDRIN